MIRTDVRLREIAGILLSIVEPNAIVYIKRNPGTTADKVAKYLQDNDVCSRLTTLKAIKKLLDLGIIRDERKGRYFHSLYFNKDFKFKSIAYNYLIDSLNDLRKTYQRYAVNNKHNEMFDRIESIIKEYKNEMDSIYALEKTSKQWIKKFENELDLEKKKKEK